MSDTVRIDKYLWAIRAFKTRSDATDACKGGKVKIGGDNAKPSKEIRVGDEILVRKGAVSYKYRVLRLAENRMGAQLVPEFAENLTPPEELAKLHAPVESFFVKRDRGAGRPTKKDRRNMEGMWDSVDFSVNFDEIEEDFDYFLNKT